MTEDSPSNGFIARFGRLAVYILTVLALLIIGGAVCAYLIATKPTPSGEVQPDPGRLVRVFKAEKTKHRLAITVYGTTQASEVWTTIAEVNGRAVEVHSRFELGEVLPADMLLVRIDPTDYKLAEKRFEAEAAAKRIQLDELDQNKKNLEDIVDLQKRQLALTKAERDRLSKAFERAAVSRSGLEVAELAYQRSRTALQETLNSLALLPVRRELAQAQLDVATTQLEQARRDLSECEIRLPMAGRCASKSVEVNQYVTTGERLGTFLALQTTEVVAMLETRRMPALFPGGIEELGTLDFTRMDLGESLWKRIHIPVKVSWGLGDRRSVWWGRVARIASSLDPGTRTVPVIIEVPDPYTNIRPGIRPPLIPEVFCELTIYGTTVDNVMVIPRDALRDGQVYLLRDGKSEQRDGKLDVLGGKLHKQQVTVLVKEEDLVVISAGLETDDLVILTDLFPATEGVPLRGKLTENPVRPRTRIDAPGQLFQQAEEKQSPPAAIEPTSEAIP
jgi:multidrug efflux pump subunit AcrA (membrane-fusion protein)